MLVTILVLLLALFVLPLRTYGELGSQMEAHWSIDGEEIAAFSTNGTIWVSLTEEHQNEAPFLHLEAITSNQFLRADTSFFQSLCMVDTSSVLSVTATAFQTNVLAVVGPTEVTGYISYVVREERISFSISSHLLIDIAESDTVLEHNGVPLSFSEVTTTGPSQLFIRSSLSLLQPIEFGVPFTLSLTHHATFQQSATQFDSCEVGILYTHGMIDEIRVYNSDNEELPEEAYSIVALDGSAFPRHAPLAASPEGGLSWHAYTGTMYRVQHTPDLITATWSNVSPSIIGSGHTNHFLPGHNAPQGFYRLGED